jgi:cytoskeleton protein RodZ
MKTVGKQLEEARLARNWTLQLASRETKIKVDRLRDLEGDDYSHFASPTYARGFVRTYARSLGLDEYKILRQLDNKLPDDDSGNIGTETGVAYLPETSMPPRAAHRDYTGLYLVMALGAAVALTIVFVLFEAYRVGELSSYFRGSPERVAAGTTSGTNADGTPAIPTADATARALPVDSNTPPPIVEATNETSGTLGTIQVAGETNADLAASPASPVSPRALPVDPSELTDAAPATPGPDTPSLHIVVPAPAAPTASGAATKVPPRALPVDPSELTNEAPATPGPDTPSLHIVVPAPAALTASEAATNAAPPTAAAADSGKRLVLTASQDSFVRVTNLDAPEADKPLYAAVLHSGQSVGFDGHKFSINVGVPSAVDIKLDGVNYGPHSDQIAPETFTVQSHLP